MVIDPAVSARRAARGASRPGERKKPPDARLRALNLDTFAVATADERTALQNLITGGGGGGTSAVQQPRLLNAYRVGRSSEAGISSGTTAANYWRSTLVAARTLGRG